VAVWLSAINAAKARIARLIIATPVILTQQLQTPLLIPLPTGLGMKVRGPHLSGKSGTHPAPPSSHRWGAQAKIWSERLQIIYRNASNDALILRD